MKVTPNGFIYHDTWAGLWQDRGAELLMSGILFAILAFGLWQALLQYLEGRRLKKTHKDPIFDFDTEPFADKKGKIRIRPKTNTNTHAQIK